MDLSKLPKLSQTAAQPPAPPPAPQPNPGTAAPPEPVISPAPPPPAPPGKLAEAWISIAVGVIVLLMQQPLLTFIGSKLGMCSFTYDVTNAGVPITYPQSIFFGHDLGLGIFGMALVLDGLVMFTARRPLLWLALGITLIATIWNLLTVCRFYTAYGLQILPALAVAFGIYIAIWQWRLLKTRA